MFVASGCCIFSCFGHVLLSGIFIYIICYIASSFSKTFQYYARFLCFYILVSLAGLICLIFVFRPRRSENFSLPNFFLRCFAKSLGLKVEVSGLEHIDNDEPMLLICNHQSSMDMIGAATIWPKKCTVIAKKSLLFAGPFGPSAWLCHTIFIDRGNREQAMKTMDQTGLYIKEQKVKLFMFPEGTRRCGTTLLPFKKGAFHVAVKGQMPIVPIVFSSYLPFLDHSKKKFTSGSFRVTILPPISTVGKTRDDIDDLLNQSRDQMVKVFEEGISNGVSKGSDDASQ